MTVASFIKVKARQLVYYLRSFWRGELPYQEVHLFFWDTLEEWGQVSNRDKFPVSYDEQVFWHLMHQIQYWPQERLLEDSVLLRKELCMCVNYLDDGGFCPFDCVGIRP